MLTALETSSESDKLAVGDWDSAKLGINGKKHENFMMD